MTIELAGPQAFYNHPDYKLQTQAELAASRPPQAVSYIHNEDSTLWKIAKVVLFPLSIPYRALHSLAGRIILPATNPANMGYHPDHANLSRRQFDVQGEWKVKRLTIEVDGQKLDVAIMGRPSTLSSGRWMMTSNGNGEFYEDRLSSQSFQHILTKLDSNAILFNYAGVGSSEGGPNRKTMAKAYRAVLSFLEDQEKGIGAKEIIGYGHSIGGGVQGDALSKHTLKDDINYVFVKSRTFSSLSEAAKQMTGSSLASWAISLLGWNMNSVPSSQTMKAPEIIMQTANVDGYTNIAKHPRLIRKSDGVIPGAASLAKRLIEDERDRRERLSLIESPMNKLIIGIPEGHNDPHSDVDYLADIVNQCLADPRYPISANIDRQRAE